MSLLISMRIQFITVSLMSFSILWMGGWEDKQMCEQRYRQRNELETNQVHEKSPNILKFTSVLSPKPELVLSTQYLGTWGSNWFCPWANNYPTECENLGDKYPWIPCTQLYYKAWKNIPQFLKGETWAFLLSYIMKISGVLFHTKQTDASHLLHKKKIWKREQSLFVFSFFGPYNSVVNGAEICMGSNGCLCFSEEFQGFLDH